MHTPSMDKVTGISVLKQALALPEVSRSSIGRALGIDASQVSRIAAGRFVKLDGNALKVCKFAQRVMLEARQRTVSSPDDITIRFSQLAASNSEAARAVSDLVDSLLSINRAD